jgi:hypothetical protein
MKKLLLLFIVSVQFVNSQTPSIQWVRTYNDGNATPPQGSFTYNATDAQGNVYTLGKFSATKDFDASAAVFNLTASNTTCSNYITKYDTSGNFIWAKTFGATGSQGLDRPQAITVDATGNVYVTGSFIATNDFDPGTATFSLQANVFFGTNYDTMFVLKLDTNGNFVWANRVAGLPSKGLSIKVDSSSSVIASSFLNQSNAAIVKYDSSGTLLWQKEFAVGINNSQLSDIAIDSNDNVVMASNFSGTTDLDPGVDVLNVTSVSNSTDFFVVKLDSSGNFIFGKNIGAGFEDFIQSVAVDSNNDIYVNGTYTTTVDFDPSAGVYNLTANPASNPYYNDGFIVKLSSSGSFVWAKSVLSTTFIDFPYDLQIDANNNVYTIGVFQELGNAPVDFDPGVGIYNLVGGVGSSCYFLKLNQNGDFVWAFLGNPLGITWNDLRSLAIDSNGALFLARTGYLVKINQPTTLGVSNFNQSEIAVFPNPTSSILNLKTNIPAENGTLKIISLTGQIVFERNNLSGTEFTIDVSNLPAGIYLLQIDDKNSSYNSKFIKQY